MTRLQKTIWNQMEKAIQEYRLIESGDRVLVGVSGGPDSLSLLNLLHERRTYGRDDFSLAAIHIDLGFEEEGTPAREILERHFKSLSVEYRIIRTEISQAALAPGARKNPCFICSHQRRKRVYEAADQEKCNKIAYGHHKDDIIETLLINILYGRKIEAMNPAQKIFRGEMTVIRPLAYVEEKLLKKYALESNLPQLARLCPMDGQTRRQRVKEIIAGLQGEEKNANIRENIFRSLSHVNINFSPISKKS